jgi:N-dimethylarginine dimethylaminohydrolase
MSAPTFLICPPDHFTVEYEINPYMSLEGGTVDRDAAHEQWSRFRDALREAGAEVIEQKPIAGLPDLVFTANAGFVCNGRVLLSRFLHKERQGETPHDAELFAGIGLETEELPTDAGYFEGTGDAILFGSRVFCGYGRRTSESALSHVERFAGVPLVPIHLVDDRFYHLDLVIAPLDEGERALVVPSALDDESRERVKRVIPEPILLTDEEALAFCANSVVVNGSILMNRVPDRVGKLLEENGLTPVEVPVPEFLKAGGSLRCLSLRLDAHAPTDSPVT